MTLPSSLQSLSCGWGVNQSLERVTLPSSLQSLSFGSGLRQSLDRVTLPSSLQKLETCRLTDLAPSEPYVSLNETPMTAVSQGVTDTNVLQSPAAISSKNCCLRMIFFEYIAAVFAEHSHINTFALLRQFELQFQGERNTVTCLGSNAMSGRENWVKCVRYHLFPPMTFLQIPFAGRKAN